MPEPQPIRFNGVELLAEADGALVRPEERLLIAADLPLEKSRASPGAA